VAAGPHRLRKRGAGDTRGTRRRAQPLVPGAHGAQPRSHPSVRVRSRTTLTSSKHPAMRQLGRCAKRDNKRSPISDGFRETRPKTLNRRLRTAHPARHAIAHRSFWGDVARGMLLHAPRQCEKPGTRACGRAHTRRESRPPARDRSRRLAKLGYRRRRSGGAAGLSAGPHVGRAASKSGGGVGRWRLRERSGSCVSRTCANTPPSRSALRDLEIRQIRDRFAGGLLVSSATGAMAIPAGRRNSAPTQLRNPCPLRTISLTIAAPGAVRDVQSAHLAGAPPDTMKP
jgi:hypothetical protein